VITQTLEIVGLQILFVLILNLITRNVIHGWASVVFDGFGLGALSSWLVTSSLCEAGCNGVIFAFSTLVIVKLVNSCAHCSTKIDTALILINPVIMVLGIYFVLKYIQ